MEPFIVNAVLGDTDCSNMSVLDQPSFYIDNSQNLDLRPQREGFFESTSQLSDRRFHQYFRMSKGTFNQLMTEILAVPKAEELFPQPLVGKRRQNTLAPEKRVSIGLWYLATQDTHSSIAALFNVTESTVFDAVTHLSLILCELEGSYISWPSVEAMEIEEANFFTRYGFPGVIGAVDGTHIQMLKPRKNSETYFNRKKAYSINTLLVCNSKEEIVFYSSGSPGSYHDARVLRRSNLPTLMNRMPSQYHLLGDSAYPIDAKLLKPFQDRRDLLPRLTTYNKLHSATRVIIENAIGRLKVKWQRMKKINTSDVKRARLLSRACFVLHNFVLKHECKANDCSKRTAFLPSSKCGINKREAISRVL